MLKAGNVNTNAGSRKGWILVVDDEPDLCTLFRMALEHASFKVLAYEDPVLALVDFRPGLFDLVILDIKMPKMDGFKLYKELRKKDSRVKICFLTASELYYEEYRKREYESMDKELFIRKPITNEDLVENVKRILADKRVGFLPIIHKIFGTIRTHMFLMLSCHPSFANL
jgi:DNA-binding response OmpR family regulator